MASDRAADTARVFADVRDFPIYVSHIDDHTRILFAPWRIWDGLTFLAGASATVWATWHWFDSGLAMAIVILGGAATAGATFLTRQIPVSRPSPLYRMLWLAQCFLGTQRRGVQARRR